MGAIINDTPEEKLAKRIFKRHSLKMPFNLEKLVTQYAKLHYKPFPINGIDGVALDIKDSDKATIIVNSNIPKTRQLFTLAHELGHIIIPWHYGSIIDEIDSNSWREFEYRELEQEANRFAAELLMPQDWLLGLYNQNNDLSILHKLVCERANVSEQAAAIRIGDLLPPNTLYCSETLGEINYSGASSGTFAEIPYSGNIDPEVIFPDAQIFTMNSIQANTKIHWWVLDSQKIIKTNDSRPWREILDEIIYDLSPKEGAIKFKQQLNGKLSWVNGKLKERVNYDVDSLSAACIQRLSSFPEFKAVIEHRNFNSFLRKRAEDFVNEVNKNS